MYFTKTRNWSCKQWVSRALTFSQRFGVNRGDGYTDGDGKFYFESDSLVKTGLVFLYFLALSRWSGGWTYIYNTAKYPNGFSTEDGYNHLYL